MKTKGGIDLIVGQQWKGLASGTTYEIVALHNRHVVVYDHSHPRYTFFRSMDSLRLMQCPVLGDLTNYRIVSQSLKRRCKIPDCLEVWIDEAGWFAQVLFGFNENCIYRVPDDFDDWEEKEAICDVCKGTGMCDTCNGPQRCQCTYTYRPTIQEPEAIDPPPENDLEAWRKEVTTVINDLAARVAKLEDKDNEH